MGDVEEWAQQSNDFPMPISTELSNICLLVASVATNKQVVSFAMPAEVKEDTSSPQPGSGEKEPVGPGIGLDQQLLIEAAEEGPEVALNFDPIADDFSGTVAACQSAYKSYCQNHLVQKHAGVSCFGPQARPAASAYSMCTTDEQCHVYGETKYKMTCQKNKCTPSFKNLRELKFMAVAGEGNEGTCKTHSQGKEYTEIGDFNKKNRGQKDGKKDVNTIQTFHSCGPNYIKDDPTTSCKPSTPETAMQLRVQSNDNECVTIDNSDNAVMWQCTNEDNSMPPLASNPVGRIDPNLLLTLLRPMPEQGCFTSSRGRLGASRLEATRGSASRCGKQTGTCTPSVEKRSGKSAVYSPPPGSEAQRTPPPAFHSRSLPCPRPRQ